MVCNDPINIKAFAHSCSLKDLLKLFYQFTRYFDRFVSCYRALDFARIDCDMDKKVNFNTSWFRKKQYQKIQHHFYSTEIFPGINYILAQSMRRMPTNISQLTYTRESVYVLRQVNILGFLIHLCQFFTFVFTPTLLCTQVQTIHDKIYCITKNIAQILWHITYGVWANTRSTRSMDGGS